MTDEATSTLTLDAALCDRFVAEADATLRPPEDILRDLVRDFVEQRHMSREAEILAEIEQAVREADDPDVERIPHEEAVSQLRLQRTGMVERTRLSSRRRSSSRRSPSTACKINSRLSNGAIRLQPSDTAHAWKGRWTA